MLQRVGTRLQRTLARPVELQGVGFVTGRHVRVRFRPAGASSGVVFARVDLGNQACIPAAIDQVTGTNRRTTLGHAPLQVGLVEHVLAALHGLRIDNCIVELDAPEPPGMDGSARAFVDALQRAGIVVQAESRDICAVSKTVLVRTQDATLAIHPADGPELRVSYLLDYGPKASIPWQMSTATITPTHFAHGIAECRTFLLEEEAHALRQQGIGARTSLTDLVVFGARGPLQNTLRHANEPARHKILDIVGDLSLLGCDLRGHVVAYRSGHPLNIELARVLCQSFASVLPRQRRAA
jgi:UDP-3-O-acyl N-acetylglucosamine deacetylase